MNKINFFETDALAPYLCKRLGADQLTLTGITQFPRGVSRETWFVECQVEDAMGRYDKKLVIRSNLPSGSVQTAPLRHEYEVYRRLIDSQVPVAKALWYEGKPHRIGCDREFYLREQVEGHWEVPNFFDPDPKYNDLRIEVSKEHLQKLALVHTCDWEALGFGDIMRVPPSIETCAETTLRRMEEDLESFQIEPFPIVAEAREWLLDNTPVAPRISLIKGSNGIGEEIWQDGKIVAMSDWEMASLGDPAYDWAQLQDTVPDVVEDGSQRWGLDQALAYYEKISGIHVEKSSIDYYRIVYGMEAVVYSHHAALPIVQGTDYMARLSWVSTEVLYRFMSRLASAVGIAESLDVVPGQLG